MEFSLTNKTAVVTGASSGIGREVALLLAKKGAFVVVNYNRSRELAMEVVAEIESSGGKAVSIQADISNIDDVKRLVSDSCQALGKIDIWANIAGADILTGAGARGSDLEKLQNLIDVDLKGTINCCWEVAEVMQSQGHGCIINTSWDLAIYGMEGRNPEMFSAIKAGILGFTKSLARSLAPAIRVNDVAPGWIATAFAEEVMASEYYEMVINTTPLKRFGTPADIAAAVLYLASDEASFITGQTLKVNGGVV